MSHAGLEEIDSIQDVTASGTVTAVLGMIIECAGIERVLSVGSRCLITGQKTMRQAAPQIMAEVVGFKDDRALLMPFGGLEGIGPGARVDLQQNAAVAFPC